MYLNYEVEFLFVYIECQYWTEDWICLAWLQIHGLLMSCYPKLLDGLSHLTPSQHLSMMMRKIFHCLGNHQLAVFSPINLVLSIVSLELEQITPNWFSIISMVQQVADVRNQISQFVLLIWLRWKNFEKLFNIILRIEGKKSLFKKNAFWRHLLGTNSLCFQINNQTFIQCREMIGQHLTKHGFLPSGYQFRVVKRSKSIKRKAVDDEEEDLYDGIKRLYSEDSMETSAVRKSCSSEFVQHQDTDDRSSFLIPAVSAM